MEHKELNKVEILFDKATGTAESPNQDWHLVRLSRWQWAVQVVVTLVVFYVMLGVGWYHGSLSPWVYDMIQQTAKI